MMSTQPLRSHPTCPAALCKALNAPRPRHHFLIHWCLTRSSYSGTQSRKISWSTGRSHGMLQVSRGLLLTDLNFWCHSSRKISRSIKAATSSKWGARIKVRLLKRWVLSILQAMKINDELKRCVRSPTISSASNLDRRGARPYLWMERRNASPNNRKPTVL